MKPRISRWMAGAAVAAVAMAAPVALVFAQGPDRAMRGSRGGWGARDGSRLVAALQLTEEQQATWKGLHQKHQVEMKAHREQGVALRKALKDAADAEKPDAAAIGEAHLALKAHQEKAKAGRDAFQQELAAVLTDEQKLKFEAIQALRPGPGRWDGRRGGRRGAPGRGFGPPPIEG